MSNNKSSFVTVKFVFLVYILFQTLQHCKCAAPIVSCTFTQYTISSPIRTEFNTLVSNSSSDSWMIVSTDNSLPFGWSSPSVTSFPFTYSLNSGLQIKYNISTAGQYSVIIQFNATLASNKPMIFFGNSTDTTGLQRRYIKPRNRFTFIRNYLVSTNNIMIYLWADQNIKILSISIQQNKIQYANVYLYVHPVERTAILVTNISQSSIPLSYTSIEYDFHTNLKYNHSVGEQCMSSTGALTNPANYPYYFGTDDYINMTTNYTYSILLNGDPLKPANSSGYFTIMISKIQMGCAVYLNSSLQGNIFTDGYWNLFKFIIDPNNVKYIQTQLTLDSPVFYQYEIGAPYIEIAIKKSIFHPRINITALDKFLNVTIDGNRVEVYKCYLDNQWSLNFRAQLVAQIFQNSNITFNNPGRYIRNATNHFHNLTLNNYNNISVRFCTNQYNHFNATYYEAENILRVSFNITALSKWNNTNEYAVININNVTLIPIIYIYQVRTPDGWLTFQVNLTDINITTPLTVNDFIIASWISGWKFQSAENYQITYLQPSNLIATPTIYSSMFASNSPSNSVVSSVVNSFANFTYNSLLYTKYFTQGVGFLFCNYIITNLIAFQNLPFLYYFQQFKVVPNFYRKAISQILLLLQQRGGYQLIINTVLKVNFQLEDNTLYNNVDLLQEFTNGTNYNRLYDYGYSSDYINNNGQSLLSLGIAIGKLIMVKLLLFLPFLWLRKMLNLILSYWKEIILIQFVVMAPTVVPILTSHSNQVYYVGFQTFLQTFNFILYVFTIFICGISSFLLYTFAKSFSKIHIKQIQNNNMKVKFNTQKTINTMGNIVDRKQHKKSKHKQKSNFHSKIKVKQRRQQVFKFWFVQNILYFVIPFLVGFNNPSIFIIILTFITLFRLYLLIKVRKQLQCGQFLKQLLNKILWIAFNTVYLIYWIIQLLNIDCHSNGNQTCFKIVSILDLVETFIFLGGCLSQVATFAIQCIVRTIIFIKQRIEKLNQKIKTANKNYNKQLNTLRKQKQRTKNVVLINNNISQSQKRKFSSHGNKNELNKKNINQNKVKHNDNIKNTNTSKSVKNVFNTKNTFKMNKTKQNPMQSEIRIQSHINIQSDKNKEGSIINNKVKKCIQNNNNNIASKNNVKINIPKTSKQVDCIKQQQVNINYKDKLTIQARSYKLLNQPFYKQL